MLVVVLAVATLVSGAASVEASPVDLVVAVASQAVSVGALELVAATVSAEVV